MNTKWNRNFWESLEQRIIFLAPLENKNAVQEAARESGEKRLALQEEIELKKTDLSEAVREAMYSKRGAAAGALGRAANIATFGVKGFVQEVVGKDAKGSAEGNVEDALKSVLEDEEGKTQSRMNVVLAKLETRYGVLWDAAEERLDSLGERLQVLQATRQKLEREKQEVKADAEQRKKNRELNGLLSIFTPIETTKNLAAGVGEKVSNVGDKWLRISAEEGGWREDRLQKAIDKMKSLEVRIEEKRKSAVSNLQDQLKKPEEAYDFLSKRLNINTDTLKKLIEKYADGTAPYNDNIVSIIENTDMPESRKELMLETVETLANKTKGETVYARASKNISEYEARQQIIEEMPKTQEAVDKLKQYRRENKIQKGMAMYAHWNRNGYETVLPFTSSSTRIVIEKVSSDGNSIEGKYGNTNVIFNLQKGNARFGKILVPLSLFNSAEFKTIRFTTTTETPIEEEKPTAQERVQESEKSESTPEENADKEEGRQLVKFFQEYNTNLEFSGGWRRLEGEIKKFNRQSLSEDELQNAQEGIIENIIEREEDEVALVFYRTDAGLLCDFASLESLEEKSEGGKWKKPEGYISTYEKVQAEPNEEVAEAA